MTRIEKVHEAVRILTKLQQQAAEQQARADTLRARLDRATDDELDDVLDALQVMVGVGEA